MRRIYVRLDQSGVAALIRLAEAERREPADQAAIIIERDSERSERCLCEHLAPMVAAWERGETLG